MATAKEMSSEEVLRAMGARQPAAPSAPPAAGSVPELSDEEVFAFMEQGQVEEVDSREVALRMATSMYDWRNPAPDRETYFANTSTLGELKKQGVEAESPGVGAMVQDVFVSATDAITSALWKYDPSNEGGGITMRNAADYLTGGAYSGLQGEDSTFNPPMALANTLLRGGATVAGANEFTLDFYKTLSRGLASSPKYRVEETGEFVYPGTMMPDAGVGDTTFDLLQMYKQQGKTLRPTNAEDLKDLEYGQFLQKRDATKQLETLLEQGTESGVGTIARSVGVPEQMVAAGGGMLDSINQAVDTLAVASTLAPAGYRTADLPWNQPQRPIESQAMLGSMLLDPGAIGAGALAPVRFGLSAAAKNATARTIDITARAAGKVGNLGNKGAVAAKTARQVKRLVGSAGLGYVANMVGQGSESEAAQELTKVLNYGLGAYAAFTGGALVLRGYSKYAGKVAHVLRESAVPGTSLDKGARAAVAVNPDVPLRYKDPLVRPSAYTSMESTPARLSKDMTLSPRARKLFGNLADWRAVQTVRGASAATSGAAKGVLANVPFSEPMRAAGEEDAANLMLGLGAVIGAPAGVASRYAGTAARRVSAGDSDIGRMLGEVQQLGTKRPPARADVEVRRTLTEVELAGGDVSAVVNNLTPDQLNEFAAVQGYFRDTVDLVPLNAVDFEANVGVLADGKSAGPVFYHAPDGERPRVFVNVEDAQTIRAGDLGRAFLKSDTMPDSQKAAMINGVDTLYTPDQVAARERAIAKAEVEARYAKRGVKVGDNDPEVDLRIAMNRAQWQQEFGDAGLGVRQAIAAEDLANGVVDWNRMRRGLPLGANPITFMENVLGAQARGLQISGVRIDPETGRPLDTPESIKRTNPAAADDPSVVAATKNYTDGYNKMRRDPANETPVAEPLSPERVAQIELSMTDAPARARQIIDMAGGPDGPNLTATDPTFGWRQEGNRRILSGTRLPDRVRFANHWKPHFEMIDQVQTAMDGGGFVVMRWDTIGESADVTKRPGPQYGAITREGIITRWKATTGKRSENYRTGGNLNVEIADYTTLRNHVLTVLEKKHPALDPARGGPGANLGAIMADVDLYLANRRSGVDLGTNMTPERLRIAEALTMGRRGNVFEGTIPRDGIFRDARIELVETIQPTGRRGHNMVSNNPDGSFTQPPAKPMPDMGSDVTPEAPDPKASSAAERIKRNLGSQSGAIDVSILADLVDYGRSVYRAGMDAAAWTANMIKQFGERIRPMLKQAFSSVVKAYQASRFSDTTGAVNVTGMNRGAARPERANTPVDPKARQAAFISDTGEVRATGRGTHFETSEDLGPNFLAIGAGHLGEDGFFRFGSQMMDDAMGDSPATSSAAAGRYNQSIYDQGRRPSSMLEEPPGLERAATAESPATDAVGLKSAKFLESAVGDGMENLRQRQARRPGTGVAKNDLVRFHTNDGKPIYIGAVKKDGGKSFKGWVEETEAWLPPEQTQQFRQWYKELYGHFTKIFGGRAGEMMMAWLAAQQNVSPGGALKNVFRVEDRIAGIGTGKKGGLADAKIEGVLRDIVPEGGFGPKLSDFVDSGFQRETRTYMAGRPEGGRPFVADVHTGRDSGHVDQQTLSRLKELSDEGNLFIEGAPASVKVTKTKTVKRGEKTAVVPERVRVTPASGKSFFVDVDMRGSPGSTQYEGISVWGNAMTDYLNSTQWAGGNWTPAEVQAVGWMRTLRQYGLPESTVDSALQQNTAKIFAEVNHSSGNLLPENFPALDSLSPDVQRAITTEVLPRAVDELVGIIGGSLRVQRASVGTGVYGRMRAPMMAFEVLGSPEAADLLALGLGYGSEQAATMSTVMGVGGKDSRVLVFKKTDGTKFTDVEMQSIIDDAGIGGYTMEQLPGGDAGMIADATKDFTPKGLTDKRAKVALKSLLDWGDKNGIEIKIQDTSARVTSYGNNWKNNKDGASYLSAIIERGGSKRVRDIVRFRGRYAEILREAYQRHAPDSITTTPQEQIGPIRRAAQEPPPEVLRMMGAA